MKAASVVLVRFPFSDLEAIKKRPALVLARSDVTSKVGLVTLAMITSKIEGLKLSGDYLLQHWKDANLIHPSLVRFSKVATVEADLIDKVLGRLNNVDVKAAQRAFQKQFQFWL